MLWEEYEKAKLAEGCKSDTIKEYKSICEAFREWAVQKKGANIHVDEALVKEYFVHLQTAPARHINPSLRAKKKPVSDHRIRNVWVALRSLYAWAEENHVVKHSPMRNIPAPKTGTKTIEIYSDEEIAAKINYLQSRDNVHNDRDVSLMLLLADTGLRINEALQIKLFDIDIKNRNVKVQGKGSKERVVPFGETTAMALQVYLKENKWKRNDRVFPIGQSRAWHIEKEAATACGLKSRGLHCYRHTFACKFLEGGGDPLSLMYLLGHTTLNMTNHYSQWVAANRAIKQYHEKKRSPVDMIIMTEPIKPSVN